MSETKTNEQSNCVLLTGAHGFLGSYLERRLHREGALVTTLGLNPLNDIIADLSSGVPSLPGDVRFDTVFHLAGTADAPMADAVNHLGTAHLLQALDENPPRQLVYISSCAVYGLTSGEMVTEEAALSPTTPYGNSKLAAEQLLGRWCNEHGVTLTILRPAAVIGTGMNGRPAQLARMIANGTYMDMPGLNPLRSYAHAYDVAAVAVMLAPIGGTFNVADPIPHSLHDMADALAMRIKGKRVLRVPRKVAKIMMQLGRLSPKLRCLIDSLKTDLTFSTARLYQTLPDYQPLNIVQYLHTPQEEALE